MLPDSKPTYPQFTNLQLNDGLLDQLLATVKVHVQEEFKQQRITGGDYAKVFLGSMEAVLANSTQYLLGILLFDQQKEKIEAEIKLLDLQGEKLRYEIDFMYPAQLIKLEQEGKLIEAQITKINAEILLLDSQKLLIDAQILKINAEISYIDAKILTELANTSNNFTTDSVIGRQTGLLQAQTLGFSGDLEHKVAKLHADYQTIWVTTYEPDSEAGTAVLQGTAKGDDAAIIADLIKGLV